jgi:hypothetical protein
VLGLIVRLVICQIMLMLALFLSIFCISYAMDPFHARREGEEELFGIIQTDDGGVEAGGGEAGGIEDASQFLNDSGLGMEPE